MQIEDVRLGDYVFMEAVITEQLGTMIQVKLKSTGEPILISTEFLHKEMFPYPTKEEPKYTLSQMRKCWEEARTPNEHSHPINGKWQYFEQYLKTLE